MNLTPKLVMNVLHKMVGLVIMIVNFVVGMNGLLKIGWVMIGVII